MRRTPPPKQTLPDDASSAYSTPISVSTKGASLRPKAQNAKRQRTNSTPPSGSPPEIIIPSDHEEIMAMLNKVLSEVTESRKENAELLKSLEFYASKCDEMDSRIVTLEKEKTARDLHIQGLENRIEEMERHTRSTCLEIRGIPSKPRETKQDLCNLIDKIQKVTKADIQPNAIKDVYRIRGKTNEERHLVVDFATTNIKNNTLQAVKKYNASNTTNRLNTNSLDIEGKKSPIFVSEFLTPKARRLYFLARDIARTCRYDFCWTTNGRIFLRKTDGSPPLLITNEAQIEGMKQKN